MTYETLNPVPSTDPRDLYDNAGITDKYVNGDQPFVPDRLGRHRRTWRGMEEDFDNAQEGRADQFSTTLASIGFTWIGDYGSGLNFTTRQQYIIRGGLAYKVANATTLPFTTTGTWASDQSNLELINSDQVLRSDLISTSADKGAALVSFDADVSYPTGTVGAEIHDIIEELSTLSPAVIDATGALVSIQDFSAEIMIKDRTNASWYGFKATATPAQQRAALIAANAAAKAEGNRLWVPRDTYNLDGGVAIEVPFEMDGGSIDFRGGAGANFAGTENCGLLFKGGGLTPLPALSVAVSANSLTLTFASPHSLSIGDVVCIYNPTDYSWSLSRAEYRAGEFCTVAAVPTSTTITIAEPLFDSYVAASVSMYKMNYLRGSFDFNGSQIFGPTFSQTSYGSAVKFNNLVRSAIYGLNAGASSNAQIVTDQCKSLSMYGCNANLNETDSLSGSQYGLSIANCQNMQVLGGSFSSYRHGVSMGGYSAPGSVTCRDVRVVGATMSNRNVAGGTGADMHGNTEYCAYESCLIRGGASAAGDHNAYRNCNITSNSDGFIFYGSEFKGTSHSFQNIDGTVTAETPNANFGVIHMAFLAAGTRGGNLNFENVSLGGFNHTAIPIRIEKEGPALPTAAVTLNNIRAGSTSSATAFARVAGSATWGSLMVGVVQAAGSEAIVKANVTSSRRIPAPVAF